MSIMTPRMKRALKEIGDAYMAYFVEPMKEKYPEPFTFYRTDNDKGWKKDVKPRGYWYGHLKGLAVLVATLIVTGYGLAVVFGVYDVKG